MDTLIAVLLYIHAIPGPGTYTQTQINQIASEQQPQIQAVYRDPNQLNNAMIIEERPEDQVIVISDWGTAK